KAGTAQKMVLNMISTATMVSLGKTYGGLMVDVQPRNQKLRARALMVVVQATGAMQDEAAAALDGAGDDAKIAIVTLSTKCAPAHAREVLARAGGSVRRALELSK
ncbi:MAG: N-acetylmuramic acid 6-phosphate etherase, partial [Actinomycetota bacterium]|nr:N-acetylmuramic acid 6-phosphate etherase [Actinomycetota bacterium]